MGNTNEDTICAVATGSGVGGIAVIRVSGPLAFQAAELILAVRTPCRTMKPFTLQYGHVVDAEEIVDDVLVSVFRSPKSYTGEDVVEISCHGGRIPSSRTIALLLKNGCRSAGPGEFTQRAYMNGRIDLNQAEAVSDLINARTDEAYRNALAQKNGALSSVANTIRDGLLGILARIEASIDFPEDVGELDFDICRTELMDIQGQLADLIAGAGRGIMAREGAHVVLVGRPNAGKSSLLNALLRTERAIVTDVPGTTRDTLEETVEIGGIPVRLWDTAGVRESSDTVEMLGIARTRSAVQIANLVLLVVDSSVGLTDEDYAMVDECGSDRTMIVWNKSDLGVGGQPSVSARNLTGIEELEYAIVERLVGRKLPADNSQAVLTQVRHKDAVERCAGHVRAALTSIENELPADFLSIDVRSALTAIGEISGHSAGEDVINEIFSRFCIGK